MTELISNYTHSRALVRQRITELLQLRRKLLDCGDSRRAAPAGHLAPYLVQEGIRLWQNVIPTLTHSQAKPTGA